MAVEDGGVEEDGLQKAEGQAVCPSEEERQTNGSKNDQQKNWEGSSAPCLICRRNDVCV